MNEIRIIWDWKTVRLEKIEDYEVGTFDISDIKNNNESNFKFVAVLEIEDSNSSHKTMKSTIGNIVSKQFGQSKSVWISDIICEKAMTLN